MALAYIGVRFDGPGQYNLGAGLGLFGGWDGKKDFCGRVSITTPLPDLITI